VFGRGWLRDDHFAHCVYVRSIFDWASLKACEDGHGYYDINDKWVRGKGPSNERQVLIK
jgi:hypothetical protein